MAMFDDIEDFMKKNRKGKKEEKEERGDGIFDELQIPKNDGGEIDGEDIHNEIAKLLETKFGGTAKVMSSGVISHEVHRSGNHNDVVKAIERLKDKVDLLAKMMISGLKSAGVKPHCYDADGNELQEGDFLTVPGNHKKKVLELGFGFAFLSHTEDMTKDDGVWFEEEIKERGFKKK